MAARWSLMCARWANNHILDFGRRGLTDTVAALTRTGIQGIWAGPDLPSARCPAVVASRSAGRVLIVSVATKSSGVPESRAARRDGLGCG